MDLRDYLILNNYKKKYINIEFYKRKWKIMRSILRIFIIIVILSASIKATDYYLSNSGSDSNSGTSVSSPWASISKLNSIVLKPGDNIYFKKEIFGVEVGLSNIQDP